MRIALYHDLLSGGAKRTLYEVTRRLARRHHVDVYTLSAANHNFADLRPHVAAYRVFPFEPLPLLPSPFGRANQLSRLADLARLQLVTRQIASEIERGGYDVLFVHPCQFEVASSLLRHVKKVRTVYYCQEPLRRAYETMPVRPYEGLDNPRRAWLNRIDPLPRVYLAALKGIDRRNTRSAGRVLVNSHFMQEAVQRIYGVRALVSYHGVDVQHFEPCWRPRKRMVLSVGSLTPLKGFDFIVESVGLMATEERPPLVIASNFENPPERRFLEQLACERGVDLQLLGNVSDEQLRQLYTEAQIVAYAPLREPFGLVPLEAMSSGTPVVAVREGGLQETVLHEQSGLLVPRRPQQFAAAMKRLLQDPQRAAAYGRTGRDHVIRNWSWEQAVLRLEEHLKAAAAPPAGAPQLGTGRLRPFPG